MQQPVIAELISGKPNWSVLVSHPPVRLTEAEERVVEGRIDDVCLTRDVSHEQIGLSSLRSEVASEAVVRLVSASVDLVPLHMQPLAQLTGIAKMALRAASNVAVSKPASDHQLRLGRMAGRIWILDSIRRLCLPWPAPSYVEQVAITLMSEILHEADVFFARDVDLSALSGSWKTRVDALKPENEDVVWDGSRHSNGISHAIRYALIRASGGVLVPVPIGGPSRTYLQLISQTSARMAWKRDFAALPWLFAATAVIHHFEHSHRPKEHRPLFVWSMYHLFGRIKAIKEIESDSSSRRIGLQMLRPVGIREALTAGIHVPTSSSDPIGRLELRFAEHHRGRN